MRFSLAMLLHMYPKDKVGKEPVSTGHASTVLPTLVCLTLGIQVQQ